LLYGSLIIEFEKNKANLGPCGSGRDLGHKINFGPTPTYQPRMLERNDAPSVTGSTNGLIPDQPPTPQYSNPLHNIKNLSGRFTAPQRQNREQHNQSYTNNSNNGSQQPQYEGVDFIPDDDQIESYGP
jgi:hypothetical protein